MRVELRPNGAGDMTLNRIEVHIAVENAGQRGFSYSNRCPARVHMNMNEGPGARGDGEDAVFTIDSRMPDVAGNATAPHSDTYNLLGAGDDMQGEPGMKTGNMC